jgi:hypothetical protein
MTGPIAFITVLPFVNPSPITKGLHKVVGVDHHKKLRVLQHSLIASLFLNKAEWMVFTPLNM